MQATSSLPSSTIQPVGIRFHDLEASVLVFGFTLDYHGEQYTLSHPGLEDDPIFNTLDEAKGFVRGWSMAARAVTL